MFAKIGSNFRLKGRRLRVPRSLRVAALIVMFTLSFSLATELVARANHDRDCNVDPLGLVCLTVNWDGYNAEYGNESGQCFWADFTLYVYNNGVFSWYGDEGPFYTCNGNYNTYFFATGYLGCAKVVVFDRSNGQPSQSSSADGTFNTCDPN